MSKVPEVINSSLQRQAQPANIEVKHNSIVWNVPIPYTNNMQTYEIVHIPEYTSGLEFKERKQLIECIYEFLQGL